MIIFPDAASLVLDHDTPVVPVELGGHLDRGTALEARYKWPGFEAAYRAGLTSGALCAETPRPLPWRASDTQLALITPVADGTGDTSPPTRMRNATMAIAALQSIGHAAATAGRPSIGLPPLRCGPDGPAPESLMPWLADAISEHREIDWHIYWWPRKAFDAAEIRAVLGELMEPQ